MVGVKLTSLFETQKWRVDERATWIEDDDLLLGPHRQNGEIWRSDSQGREDNGNNHPESGRNQIVGDGIDGRKFHRF